MAISGGDGSIILTTKVDTSGINKGSISIKSALEGVRSAVSKVKNSFSSFNEQKASLKTLTQALKDQQYVINSLSLEYAKLVAAGKGETAQAKELKTNIDAATAEMKEMEAASIMLGAKGSKSINTVGLAIKRLLSYFIGIQTIFKIISFSKEASSFAIETEASIQRLIDIYGEASKSVGDFIDANAMALGMSRSASASIASTYGNLLSIWADQETNAKLTNNLLNQTAVVASKTGRTTTDVAERIRSGLLGNTEAIEDLGINVNIKTIEITDAFKRIADGRSWEQLNAYEQSQVRTLAILEQSVNKYGTEVADTTALTRNQFRAAYEDFQATWGQVVNKILMPIMKWATTALSYLNGVLIGFFNLSQEMVKQSNATSSSVKNQKDLKKAVKETNKEAKKSPASFDELSILTEQSAHNAETSNADASGGPVAMPEIEDFAVSATIDTASFEEGIDVGKRLREIFEPLIDVFGEFGAVVVVVVTALLGFLAVKSLLGWLTGLGKPLTTVSAGFGKFLDKLGSAATSIAVLGGLALVIGSITDLITAFSESGLGLGEVAGLLGIVLGEVVGAFGLLLGALQLLSPSWKDIAFAVVVFGGLYLVLQQVTNLIDAFAQSGLSVGEVAGLLGAVIAEVTVAMLALVAAATILGTNPLAMLAVVAVAGALSLVLVALGAALPPILDAFGDFVVRTTPPLVLAMTTIGNAIEKIIYALGVSLPPVIEATGNLFGKIFDGISDVVNSVGENLTKILVDGIGGLIDKVLKSIINFVDEAGPAVNNFVDNIIEAVTKLINFMVSGIEYMVNRLVVDGINGIIKGINAIGKYVGFTIEPVPEFTIPRFIPKLAQGAVIPGGREFLAVLGDQPKGQTNIEAPLQTIVDAFNIALQGNANYGGGNTEVVLEIDGREFGRAVVEQGNRENRRIGTRLVVS